MCFMSLHSHYVLWTEFKVEVFISFLRYVLSYNYDKINYGIIFTSYNITFFLLHSYLWIIKSRFCPGMDNLGAAYPAYHPPSLAGWQIVILRKVGNISHDNLSLIPGLYPSGVMDNYPPQAQEPKTLRGTPTLSTANQYVSDLPLLYHDLVQSIGSHC